MKIIFGSDMHFKFWKREPKFFENRLQEIRDAKVDHVVIAGDIHPDRYIRDGFLASVREAHGKDNISICLGNHDYYNGEWYDDKFENDLFVGGCLWTDFNNNPHTSYMAHNNISDFKVIKDWKPERVVQIYRDHVDHIFSSKREFVVTHFPPTWNGIHPRYVGDPLNGYFHNNLEMRIRRSNKKLWICGHNHWNFDYMIGDCRVVSNQFCYPGEEPRKKQWKVLEI